MGVREEPWRAGAVVGEYRLLRPLGAGGMGAVDLGEHQATGAQRAIKSIIAPHDADLLRRFQREAEALVRVAGHPHVVRVHSAGIAHGRPYLVMDHLSGGDLQARLRGGPLPPAEVARLGVELASGLSHIHARGVLHRDLKPANVLFDEQARPVLVDFGLARPSGARSLTATGEALGTPSFMAPEQVHGDKDAIGPRTDVYGLGALLYAALTGRPPAEGKSPIEVMTRVLEVAPAAPRTLVPGVPPRLEEVLLRALAKRPEQRFQSIDDMSAALATALDAGRGAGTSRAALALVPLALVAVAVAAIALLRPAPDRVVEVPPAAVTTAPPAPGPERPAEVAPRRAAPVDRRPATIEDIPPPPADAVELLPPGSRGVAALGLYGVGETLRLKGEAERLAGDAECYQVAAQVYLQVAEAGKDDAAMAWTSLGRAFERGFGVRQSHLQAGRCYEAAAALGDVPALVGVASFVRQGAPGVPPDRRRARDLLLKALDLLPSSAQDAIASARFQLLLIALDDETVVSLEEARAHVEKVPTELLDYSRRQLRAALFEEQGRIDEAAEELRLSLDDESYCGQAAVELLRVLIRAGRTEEVAAARAELERRALVQAGCATELARLLQGEGKVAEAKKLYLWVAALPEDVWHRGAARRELYGLCLRHGGEPVTLERARELLLLEPDGARQVEAAKSEAAR